MEEEVTITGLEIDGQRIDLMPSTYEQKFKLACSYLERVELWNDFYDNFL